MIILEAKEEKSLMTLLRVWVNKWTLSWRGWRKQRKSEWGSEKDKWRMKKDESVSKQWRRKHNTRELPKIKSGGRERKSVEPQILWETSFLMTAFQTGRKYELYQKDEVKFKINCSANVLNGWSSLSWSVADVMGRCLRLSRFFSVSLVIISVSSATCRLRKRCHLLYTDSLK